MAVASGPTREPPLIWVIGDDRPGDTTQSIGLAQALGYPFEFKRLQFNRWARWQRIARNVFGSVGASVAGVDRARSDPLEPPWPDVVIGSTWRTAPVVRWIGRRSGGRTRTVQTGRKGSEIAGAFDVVVTPSYWRLMPHPRRIETLLPLHRVSAEVVAAAAQRWADLFGDAPRPYVVLLVGGATGGGYYRLDADAARVMAEWARGLAERLGGTLFAIGSRRTGAAAGAAIAETLHEPHRFTPYPSPGDNPYLGHMALADILVVTGESESMLAEAAAMGKPVYIYPLPQRQPGIVEAFLDLVTRRARAHIGGPGGRAFVPRLRDAACALLLERGALRPPRDLHVLHEALFSRGIGHPLDERLEAGPYPHFDELAEVAEKVRRMLFLPEPPETKETGKP
jgi:mitochondrial fission protein ELM1